MFLFRPARHRIASIALAAMASATLAACGGGGGGGGEPAKVATSIEITPGPSATVQSGSTLQLNATVLDQNGEEMTGQTVSWSSSNTSKATVSQTGLVTGLQVGVTTINAQVGSTVFAVPPVTVTVTAGAAATLTKVGDLAASMPLGTSDSVRTRVLDAQGNPVSGVTVTFAVSGPGTLSTTTNVTNAQGYAGSRVTVGGTASGQTITVTATVASLTPVTFTTTSAPGQPSQLTVTSSRIVIIDQGATTTVTVAIADAGGNPATGLVNYIARNSNVTVSTSGLVTGVSAGQSFVVAELNSNPAIRDSALIVVAIPTGPVVKTNLARFDLKADTVFTVPIIVDMRTSGEKLGSTRVVVTWDPAVLTYQSNAEGSTTVGAQVNATNAATGTLILAVADPTGFAGATEIRRITFRASATVARTGSLALGVSELNGVSPNFTDLKPKTVAVSYPLYTR
jgi:adhesin/invasin